MNPQKWPTWLKLLLGAMLVAGNAVLPWLAQQDGWSPGAQSTLNALSSMWLLIVNTWSRTGVGPISNRIPPVPPAVSIVCIYMLRAITIILLLFVVASVTMGASCTPTPRGVSIEQTEAGVETCIEWARRNPQTACDECGRYLAEAGPGI